MKFKRFSLAILFLLINFLVLFTFSVQTKQDYDEGQIAKEDIISSKEIQNKFETQQLLKKTSEQVEPIFRINPTIQAEIKSEIEDFFEMTKSIKKESDYDEKEAIELISLSYSKIEKEKILSMLQMKDSKKYSLKVYIFDVINQIMGMGITSKDLEEEKKNIYEYFEKSNKFNSKEKSLGIEILDNFLRPNKFLDIEKTQKKIDNLKSKIKPIIIKKGDIIVKKGEIISKEKLSILKELGYTKNSLKNEWMSLLGKFIFLIVIESITLYYIFHFQKEVYNKDKKFLLLIAISFFGYVVFLGTSIISNYLMPIAAISMLFSMLLGREIAIVLNISVGMIMYVITSSEEILLLFLSMGTYGSIYKYNSTQRRNVFVAGLKIGTLGSLFVSATTMMNFISTEDLIIKMIITFLSGIISSIVVIGSLPFWEHYFDVLTDMKLLELSNPNNELLQRLLMQAPGTYHHSILVGNLAERACNKIKANGLLARVGSYYHDVGKLNRPYFFKENQISIENPHDEISPFLSNQIIKEHVKSGIEFAIEAKLPREIINIIKEHHGNTLVAYFYHKAKEENEDVDKESFRYKGPIPQTKESAVIMLADSVEAGVRSIKKPSRRNITQMIDNIFKSKMNDGQLNRSNLTITDLDIIRECFFEVMIGMLHERIEYPKEEVERELKNDI